MTSPVPYDPFELQRLLKAAGFDPGPIDGDVGERTEAALVAFKRGHASSRAPSWGP